jgi:membrane associated rhomboid family serine protease
MATSVASSPRRPCARDNRRGAIWAAQILTNLPVEVENPARGTPWVTFFVIATLLAAFIAQQLGYIDLYAYAMVPGRLRHHGDIETLLSYMFLHASWVHLLGNAYFLYTFGDNVEHLFGRLRFIVFYGFAGMAAALIHYALTYKTATPVVGASGAISGIMAAYLWAYPHQRLFQVVLWIQLKIPAWMYLIVWFGFQILMGFFATGKQVEGVAWFAHLGGFLVGLAMTPWFLSLRRRQIAARVRVPARLPPSVDAPI